KSVTRSRDDDLSRSAKEREGTPKRELGTRVNGTFHDRDRQLHRAGRTRVGASVHGLPCQPEYAAISIFACRARHQFENVYGPNRTTGRRRYYRHAARKAGERAIYWAKDLALFRRGRSVAGNRQRDRESCPRAQLRDPSTLARNL